MSIKQTLSNHWLFLVCSIVVISVLSIFGIATHDMIVSAQNSDKLTKNLINSSTDCSFVKGWFVTPYDGEWLKPSTYEFAKQRSEVLKCP